MKDDLSKSSRSCRDGASSSGTLFSIRETDPIIASPRYSQPAEEEEEEK